MIGAAQTHRRLGSPWPVSRTFPLESVAMPHPFPVLAAAAAAPMLAFALHAGSPGHGDRTAPPHAAQVLPNNLCASCHGGRQVVSPASALGMRDLAVARVYPSGAPHI